VHRSTPELTMAWGLELFAYSERRDLHFPWVQGFVDKHVMPFWVDFFWNGALIDRVELCYVDGGHGVIPLPLGSAVSEFEAAVAYLVHDISRF